VTDNNAHELRDRVLQLDSDQATRVLRRLLLEIDPKPAVTDEEVAARATRDADLIRDLSQGVAPAPTPSVHGVLAAIVDEIPDSHPAMRSALDGLKQEGIRLDPGMTISVEILVAAVAGAILRPRVETETVEESDASGQRVTKRKIIEIRGIKDVGKLVKELIPFLRAAGE
jgi:hypothetical protein